MSDAAPQAVPAGLQLAHTFWGEPASGYTHAHTAGTQMGAVVQAHPSGVPYVPPSPPEDTTPEPEAVEAEDPRRFKCRAKNDTCNGWRVHGADFCAGHLGLSRKAMAGDGEPE